MLPRPGPPRRPGKGIKSANNHPKDLALTVLGRLARIASTHCSAASRPTSREEPAPRRRHGSICGRCWSRLADQPLPTFEPTSRRSGIDYECTCDCPADPRRMLARVQKHIGERVSYLTRRPQHVHVIAIGEHGSGSPEHAVHGPWRSATRSPSFRARAPLGPWPRRSGARDSTAASSARVETILVRKRARTIAPLHARPSPCEGRAHPLGLES